MLESLLTRRHRGEVAAPDDELGPGRLECGQECRDLGGIVLSIGVEGHHGRRSVLEDVPEPGPQRCTLACIGPLDEDRRAGRLCLGRGVVRRAVVDDHDREVETGARHDGRDPRSFLVARDERDDVPCFVHGIGPVVAPPPGFEPGTFRLEGGCSVR